MKIWIKRLCCKAKENKSISSSVKSNGLPKRKCKLSQISFLIKLIKNGEPTENSETVESICTTQGGINHSDKGSATIQFACQIQGDYDSIEIISSDNIAGIPSDPNLLNPVITSIFIDTDSLIYPDTPLPQLVEQPIIDYTKAGNGLLEFTTNLRQADGNIKEGQSFKIKLLYPNGIILKFTITEINELTIKLDCEIDGEVIDQRLYVEQTAIVADGKYLFILPGFKTEIITVNENVLENEMDEEEKGKEQAKEPEKEQTEEKEKEQTKEAEKEQIEEKGKE